MRGRFVIAAAFAAALPASAEWLHYRGPAQNGVVPEKLPHTLSQPRELWKTKVGTGTCSVTAMGRRIFTAGNRDNRHDVVVCLDAATGKPVWQHRYDQPLEPNMFEGGPRATPTLDGDRVYALAQAGDLFCLDAATGKVKWHKHLVKDFRGRKPGWGYSGSPTIEGDVLIVETGSATGSTLALNKMTGALVWQSGSDEIGYSTPVVADIAGERTVVVFKAKALVGINAKTGHELWRAGWKTDYDIHAATPLVAGNLIVISSGYGTGIGQFEVSSRGIAQKWRNRDLRAHINSPVIRRNAIFGIDGNTGGGNLVCLDLVSGKRLWIERSVKGGSLVLADDKLVVLTEKGELVIAPAIANEFKPLLRARLLDKCCWVQPTLSDGLVFVKNNEGDLACLELK